MQIKFILSKGNPITLPYEKALAILKSKDQIVMVSDTDGSWSGVTINRAFVVNTVPDYEAIDDNSYPQLPEVGNYTEEEDEAKLRATRKAIEETAEKLRAKKII